jgi:hypothetical protein
MLRLALLLVMILPMAACQLALPIAATQVGVPIATSQTVLRGTKQMVEIRTEPAGATVNIPGYATRTTPTFIMLARGHSHTVTLVKDGFKTVTTCVASKRGVSDASNVIGGALDQASGAAWELNPDRLSVTLEPVAGAALASADAATVKTPATPPATAATPPIAQPTLPPAVTDKPTIISEQIARLDKLLEQGVITKREHEILMAMALSATAVAGAPTSP